MYLKTYTHTLTQTLPLSYALSCTHTHIHVYALTHTHIHTHTYTHIHTHAYSHTHTYACQAHTCVQFRTIQIVVFFSQKKQKMPKKIGNCYFKCNSMHTHRIILTIAAIVQIQSTKRRGLECREFDLFICIFIELKKT